MSGEDGSVLSAFADSDVTLVDSRVVEQQSSLEKQQKTTVSSPPDWRTRHAHRDACRRLSFGKPRMPVLIAENATVRDTFESATSRGSGDGTTPADLPHHNRRPATPARPCG